MGGVLSWMKVAVAATGMLSAAIESATAWPNCSANGKEERLAREFHKTWEKIKEDQIRAVIAAWYGELRKGPEGRIYALTTPLPILEHCECLPPDVTPTKYAHPAFRNELAYDALKFSYEIEAMRADDNFARVEVWERGWYYAWAVEKTYENDADTSFVLERGDDGAWRVLAYSARGSAVPQKYADEPTPDLREEYFKKFPSEKVE